MAPGRELMAASEYRGGYTGSEKRGFLTYDIYQFSEALKSTPDRVLTIRVPRRERERTDQASRFGWLDPEDWANWAIISDSEQLQSARHPVTLNRSPPVYSPSGFTSTSPRGDQERRDASEALLHHPADIFLWINDRAPASVRLLLKREDKQVDEYLVKDRLRYIVRDPARVRTLRLNLLWAVPVDLTTFPAQLWMLLAFGRI